MSVYNTATIPCVNCGVTGYLRTCLDTDEFHCVVCYHRESGESLYARRMGVIKCTLCDGVMYYIDRKANDGLCSPCRRKVSEHERRTAIVVADIEACGGTPDAMRANPDIVRKFETYRGQQPVYIDTPSGRIRLTVDPGMTPQFSPVDLKAEAEANGYKESDILKLGDKPDPVDPLDVEYDGVTLRRLIEIDRKIRIEVFKLTGEPFTSAQRAAISAHWSAQLRVKVAEAKAKERNAVTYCEEDEP